MLILYHDYPSAASLHAVLVLQELADAGAEVAFHGIDVLGLGTAVPATLDDLADWQAQREALAALGWELPRPRLHPSTVSAHVVEALATVRGLGAAWRLACHRALWLAGDDLGDRDVLAGLAAGIGLDADEVAALLDDSTRRLAARRGMAALRGEGVGGVPVLQVNGTMVSPFMDPADLRELAAL